MTEPQKINVVKREKFVELPVITIHHELTYLKTDKKDNSQTVIQREYDPTRGITSFLLGALRTVKKLEGAKSAHSKEKLSRAKNDIKRYEREINDPGFFAALSDFTNARAGTSNIARTTDQISIKTKGVSLSEIRTYEQHECPVLGTYTAVYLKGSKDVYCVRGTQQQVTEQMNTFSLNDEPVLDVVTPWEELAEERKSLRDVHAEALAQYSEDNPLAPPEPPKPLGEQAKSFFARVIPAKKEKAPKTKAPQQGK